MTESTTSNEPKGMLVRGATVQQLAELAQATSNLQLQEQRNESIRTSVDAGVLVGRRMTAVEKHQVLRTGGEVYDTTLGRLLFHPQFETFGGFVVLFNFAIMSMETQATATDDDSLRDFVAIVNKFLLAYYTLECVMRFYVMKQRFFLHLWNNLDMFIVVTGLSSEILEISEIGSGDSMDQIAMLKSLRLLRLLRLVRLLVAFRELYVLVAGIGRCMKTLMWAAGLIFVTLNVWAILSVELLHQRVMQLHTTTDKFTSCNWCIHAFSNIWHANVTWFQIISTSDWVAIGRPLVEEFWWPYIFFVTAIFIVIWGLLNLIIAAIVDASIAARQDDMAIASKLVSHARNEAWCSFARLCQSMDEDGSGDITVEEFRNFWKSNVELQQHLTVMGVAENDLEHLLKLMDEDGSGNLECGEFIEEFTTMRTLVEKTTLYFLLKFSQSIQSKLIVQGAVVHDMNEDLADVKSTVDTLYNDIGFLLGDVQPTRFKSSDYLRSRSVTDEASDRTVTRAFSGPMGVSSSSDSVRTAMPSARGLGASSLASAKNLGAGNLPSARSSGASNMASKSNPGPHVRFSGDAGAQDGDAPDEDTRTSPLPDGDTRTLPLPDGDTSTLPLGWYYFGASLPVQAGQWCEAMDRINLVDVKARFRHGKASHHISKDTPFSSNGQQWEPLPAHGLRVAARNPHPVEEVASAELEERIGEVNFFLRRLEGENKQHGIGAGDFLQTVIKEASWEAGWDDDVHESPTNSPNICPGASIESSNRAAMNFDSLPH